MPSIRECDLWRFLTVSNYYHYVYMHIGNVIHVFFSSACIYACKFVCILQIPLLLLCMCA